MHRYTCCTSRGRVASSPGERKLNMPDSISQSTATVLRINGREMSYCAIFVRDLCARPSPRSYATLFLRAKRERFVRSLARSLARADIAVTRPANAPAADVSCPTLPPRIHSLLFFLSLFFPPHNGDCIGIAFFRPMLIDFFTRWD